MYSFLLPLVSRSSNQGLEIKQFINIQRGNCSATDNESISSWPDSTLLTTSLTSFSIMLTKMEIIISVADIFSCLPIANLAFFIPNRFCLSRQFTQLKDLSRLPCTKGWPCYTILVNEIWAEGPCWFPSIGTDFSSNTLTPIPVLNVDVMTWAVTAISQPHGQKPGAKIVEQVCTDNLTLWRLSWAAAWVLTYLYPNYLLCDENKFFTI